MDMRIDPAFEDRIDPSLPFARGDRWLHLRLRRASRISIDSRIEVGINLRLSHYCSPSLHYFLET
jgi:hypothetical protein